MKKEVYRLTLSFLFVLILGMIFGATGVSAADGHVTFSIEKFTLGKGYYMEPTIVPIEEGDTIADVTAAVLGDDNYLNTGSGSSMYFSHFRDSDDTAPNIPQYILRAIGKSSKGETTEADVLKKGKVSPSWLGEFDYYYMSGWMICSNNYFINVSTGAYPVQDGDVIRWQYTIYGLGADLGSAFMNPDFIISTANKDALTEEIAKINTGGEKDTLLQDETFKRYYDNAMFILETMTSTQDQVDMALANLQGTSTEEPTLPDPDYIPADYNVLDVMEAIDALPAADGVTLDDENDIKAAREAYNALDAVDRQLTTNVSRLTAAEDKIAELNPKTNIEDMTDMKKTDWYYEDVDYVLSHGIFTGMSATTFGPNEYLTRGQFVTTIGRLEGVKSLAEGGSGATNFSDVKATSYYAPYVKWAAENGIVNGTGNGNFSPDAKITREQMATIIVRYAEKMGVTLTDGSQVARFVDDGNLSDWAKEAVYDMKASEIISGVGGNQFDPQGNATRAQAAKILHLLNKLK